MLQIENLTKQYGSFQLSVSLSVPEGRVTGLVGRNGAGKTTTIKALLGLLQPDSGSVLTLGKPAAALTPADKTQLGVALSGSGFSSYFTLDDVARILGGFYPGFDKAAFLRLCGEHGLPRGKRLKEFSTGMNARLRVLAAISHDARLLVLDEPTAGLDVIARGEVLDLLRAYLAADSRRSLLISSHISSDLEGLCDDIYLLHNGKVVLHEETDVLLSEYAVLRLTEAQYAALDKQYILRTKKEAFGYSCFTNKKQFYAENAPGVVLENGSIDDLIIMFSGEVC